MKKAAWIILPCLLVLAGVFLWLMDFGSWVSLDTQKIGGLSQTTVVYDRYHNEAAGLSALEDRRYLAYADIPPTVKNAFLAAEDQRFFTHKGIDVYRIFGALWQDIKSMSLKQGASTITQQLIKLTHLTNEKTLSRKANEAYLALRLEKEMSKEEILTAYINTVYFGGGAYGVEAAARHYFGVGTHDLSAAQAAMLAGIIKAPGIYSPSVSVEKATTRRNAILDDMFELGMLTREEYTLAVRAPIVLHENAKSDFGRGWYADAVIDEATRLLNIGADQLLTGGYRIYTALDPRMQQSAETLFRDKANFPQSAGDGTLVEAALCCVDADTGGILALIGGREYQNQRALNRATQIRRQPGSALKPVCVYAAAVDRYGLSPTSLLDDTRREFEGGYTPANASGKYYGIVTLREALSRSLNVATVDLLRFTGIGSAREYAQRAGLTLNRADNGLSLALGALTDGVSPANLAAAYAPLANGGAGASAHTVETITDFQGNVLYIHQTRHNPVMSEDSAYIITDMLKTAASSGSAHALSACGFPVAGKTGTVSQQDGGNRDIWTVAYTGKAVVSVWMGYDRPDEKHMLPPGTVGSGYPARMAAAFLRANAADVRAEFPIPGGLTTARIDLGALKERHQVLLATEYTPASMVATEIFREGDAPTQPSLLYEKPLPVDDLAVDTSENGYPRITFTSPQSGATYVIVRTDKNARQTVAEIDAEEGERVVYEDALYPGEACGYSVIPRHRALYESGRSLTGDETQIEYYAPDASFLSGVRRLFGG